MSLITASGDPAGSSLSDDTVSRSPRQEGLQFLLVAAIVLLILVLRTPDSFFRAQFWAEDGTVYFKDAFELKATQSVLKPHRGYLQVFTRVAAEVSQVGPYALTPLVCNLIAGVTSALTVALLATTLYAPLIPQPSLRFALALLVAAGGNHSELLATITNTQWYFALLGIHALMLVWCHGPSRWGAAWCALMCAVAALSVLSAPQSIVFLPFLLLPLFLRRAVSRENQILIAVFVLACLAQVICYALVAAAGKLEPRDDPGHALLRNVPVALYYRGLVQNYVPQGAAQFLLTNGYAGLVHVLALGAVFAFVVAARRKPWFLALVGLLLPINAMLVYMGRPQQAYADGLVLDAARLHTGNSRYYFLSYFLLLMVSFIGVSEYFSRPERARWLALPLLLQITAALSGFATAVSWQNFDWKKTAAELQALEPGKSLRIHLNPGGPWYFDVTRPPP
jgi:hypothetical protein